MLLLLQSVLAVWPDRSDLELDRYGMEKLKKRILEFLAVRQLKNEMKGTYVFVYMLWYKSIKSYRVFMQR